MDREDPIIPRWLEEVLRRVQSEGAQPLVVEGRHRMMIITEREFRLLKERKPTFKEWLLSAPPLDELDLTRDPSPPRDIDL